MAMYYLVDKTYEVVDKIDSITQGGAVEYFMKRKQIEDEQTFKKIWSVVSKKEYNLNMEAFSRKPSSEHFQWWKDEESYLDVDAPITQSGEEE
tara:strand:+ start:641 stop:919 length:279 start_codon:yes stop_codon:yes gene_type:complete